MSGRHTCCWSILKRVRKTYCLRAVNAFVPAQERLHHKTHHKSQLKMGDFWTQAMVSGFLLLNSWLEHCETTSTTATSSSFILTFLTRSNWTSPGGSGRTLLFLQPIISLWASAQSATQATRSPASSPQQLIQQPQDIQLPDSTRTQKEGSWIKLITPTHSPDELASAVTDHEYTSTQVQFKSQEFTKAFGKHTVCPESSRKA